MESPTYGGLEARRSGGLMEIYALFTEEGSREPSEFRMGQFFLDPQVLGE